MKTIKGDLILTKNTEFKEGIKVKGNIKGKDNQRFDLKVNGNIDARDINAVNIDAWDIDAWNIVCDKRIKKSKNSKTRARIFIENKLKLERKEW